MLITTLYVLGSVKLGNVLFKLQIIQNFYSPLFERYFFIIGSYIFLYL